MVRFWCVESESMMEAQADSATAKPTRGDGFFSDPAMDRFAAAFLRLLSEHWVQAEKLSSLVQLLEDKNLIAPGDVEKIGQSADSDPDRDLAAHAFVRRILEPLRERV